MKAFRFRLDQALRWRETQANLQKARVAAATARVAEIERTLQDLNSAVIRAAAPLVEHATGVVTQSYAAFSSVTRARIRQQESQAVLARRNTELEIKRLIEASQKVRVLEKLKTAQHTDWHADFERELTAFADEAFLGRRAKQRVP